MTVQNITSGITLFTDSFQNVTFFQIEWILSIILVGFTLLILTREFSTWAQLALPVTVGWDIVGIEPSLIFYIFVAIAFVFSHLSFQMITGGIEAVTKPMWNVGARLRSRQHAWSQTGLAKQLGQSAHQRKILGQRMKFALDDNTRAFETKKDSKYKKFLSKSNIPIMPAPDIPPGGTLLSGETGRILASIERAKAKKTEDEDWTAKYLDDKTQRRISRFIQR